MSENLVETIPLQLLRPLNPQCSIKGTAAKLDSTMSSEFTFTALGASFALNLTVTLMEACKFG